MTEKTKKIERPSTQLATEGDKAAAKREKNPHIHSQKVAAEARKLMRH